MELATYLIPILVLCALCAGWVGVQLLARKLGTKNHMEHGHAGCGNCTGLCDTDACKKEKQNI
jgi:hypothetical protein